MASRYRVEQRHITHRGRKFHFVSYEGQPANQKRNQPASDHAWFLVNAGYRWEVMPQEPDAPPEETDRRLSAWIEREVFGEDGQP